jgi:tetraacyldisaccharide 4'-kinase
VSPGLVQFAQGVMSGAERGVRAGLLRAGMMAAEPFYAGAMRARNWLYQSQLLKTHALGRPVISVGNMTTGGTGKTPVVRWLAERLSEEGKRVGILSRGYRSEARGMGDELTMLDRVAGAKGLVEQHPEVQVLILDDAFQHRKAGRDLDILLISAANPFGFGHVLPRGLLREPMSGLSRAGAIIITHADQQSPGVVCEIEEQVRQFNPAAPIYRAVHALVGLRNGEERLPMEALAGRRYFAFCGIGNPQAFERQLEAFGSSVGHRRFGDHHGYAENDLASLDAEARAAGADLLVTTEKDWVKIASLRRVEGAFPIWRVQMELRFLDGDGDRLLGQVRAVL